MELMKEIAAKAPIIVIFGLLFFGIYLIVRVSSMPKSEQLKMGVCFGPLPEEEKLDWKVRSLIQDAAAMDLDRLDQTLLVRNKARKLIEEMKEMK